MAWLDVARCRLDEDCICICICILHAVLQECVRRYICTRRIDDWCKGRVCSCWKLLRDGNYQISRHVPETATTFYLIPPRVGKPFLLSYYGMRPGNLVIIPSPPALRGPFTLLRCCPLEEVDLFVSDLCSFFTAIFTCYLPR